MRGTLLFPLLLLLTLPAAAQPMVVEQDTQCVGGELVVDSDITIKSGARLLLQDCTLVFQADYEDQWISTGLQGHLLHVEEGGVLEVRTVDGEAGLRAADRAYAYSLLVDGDLVLQGSPDHRVKVSGLEGYMTETDIVGGVRVTGTALTKSVDFTHNQGPALHVLPGGHATGQDLDIRKNTGGVGVVGGTLELTDVYVNVGIIDLIAHNSDVVLDNATFLADQVAIQAHESNLTVRDSDIAGGRVALELVDANAMVHDTQVRYGQTGVSHIHRESYQGDRTTIELVRSNVVAVVQGRDSTAIWNDHADLHIIESTLVDYNQIGINHHAGAVVLTGSELQGTGQFHGLLNRPRSMTFDGATFTGDTENGVIYAGSVVLTVVDRDGPVANATVTYSGGTETTNEKGLALLAVAVPVDGNGRPVQDMVEWSVQAGNRTRNVQVGLDVQELVVNLDAPIGASTPGLPVVLLLAALAVGAALVRRQS